VSEQNGWAPPEPERSGSTSRYVQPKNWMEVTEGSGKAKRVFQRFKCRVLGKAISGFTAWTADNKPVRFRAEKDIPADFNWRLKDDGPHKGKKELPKAFWAFPCWDYEAHEVKVWEVSQAGIREAIGALARNPEWGSPLGYDLTIERSGKGLDTKYAVSPSPKSAVDVEAAGAFNDLVAAGFDMERLFDGGDPFSAPAAAPVATETQPVIPF
jgi:hypothetical protein